MVRDIVLAGTGNVASHIASALADRIAAVCSRTAFLHGAL